MPQTAAGDVVGVSQQIASIVVQRVVNALVTQRIMDRFIACNVNDRQWCLERAGEFARICRLPNVIGAVDGSLVKIRTPSRHGHAFRCRKGFAALNVVACVDARYRILFVNSLHAGSWHDARCLSDSDLGAAITTSAICPGFTILGDSGYANGAYLSTPYRPTQVHTVAQRRFNRQQRRARVVVEQVFGQLKQRFGILSSGIRLSPERASRVVSACCVLHNISIALGNSYRARLGRRLARIPIPIVSPPDMRLHLTNLL